MVRRVFRQEVKQARWSRVCPKHQWILLRFFLFFCPVWSHVHLVPHKHRTKWASWPQRAQTLRQDAGDQSRWMDKRIHENNGKALIWMTHCEHNVPTTRNKWKSWIQKVLLWKRKNFVLWWPYAVNCKTRISFLTLSVVLIGLNLFLKTYPISPLSISFPSWCCHSINSLPSEILGQEVRKNIEPDPHLYKVI